MSPHAAKQSNSFPHRILVVDDDPAIRKVSADLLARRGYEVKTASDGFEALAKLQRAEPDVIISDLRMPNMSGFEFLSVVRRRFPHVPVIVISSEFEGTMPIGVLADVFFTKSEYKPEELITAIAELLEQSPLRAEVAKPHRAPVWFPRSSTNYYVLTCTECLRSFSVNTQYAGEPNVHQAECVFCGAVVRYSLQPEVTRKGMRRAQVPSRGRRSS
jgi:CheY-like chemotaxis protein